MVDKIVLAVYIVICLLIIGGLLFLAWYFYRKLMRDAKNHERGLKMVALHINLPPSSTDIESDRSGKDQRDLTDEILSQAEVMYNILASTVYKGFKSKIYGQRHLSFEIVSKEGLIYYYAVVPFPLLDVVKQAISTAYPAARIEETDSKNIFDEGSLVDNVVGGEFSLREDAAYPILTYQESKKDASRSLLNALSKAKGKDGVSLQILIRPAGDNWAKNSLTVAKDYREEKTTKKKKNFFWNLSDLLEALWKPPEVKEGETKETKQLNSVDQSKIEAIENKAKHVGFETLIRVVVSSDNKIKSEAILQNIMASFSLFNSPSMNGFKFNKTKKSDHLVAAYIMRLFPQEIDKNILNSIELATIFHLPSQKDIPTAQLKRLSIKQVDGPTERMDEGLLLGYNEFRGNKKPIRLSVVDRRRHTYFIGQTGTGKSGLLENLAYQDIMDGRGFAFIDPHGDSAEKIMGMIPKERINDVIYFNPSDLENPVGLNLFEFETDDQRDFLIQEGIQMLYSLYDPGHTGIVGPRFEHWFRNAALALMADPNGSTFIDIPQMFNDQSFADYKLQFVKDKTVLDFWQKEMAIMPESAKGEILGWFASKFGAFLSNEMMRNIIGQTKSGFGMREIMDNKKILLVNLSKGKTGELNSKLLGMIFIMKFQVAAMGRADMPEEERQDFCLYVDEFQNFATDSFESILSEARKYHLNIIVANQFMTQLTDKIKEAIIGNVGTIISGRIGVTDAELLQKRFMPTFNAEDLSRLPNYQTITTVMINNTPSDPFSMNLIPPVGQSRPEIRDAMKQLSAAKYGQTRAQVSQEIYKRLSASLKPKRPSSISSSSSGSKSSSFLDEWLKKRKELKKQQSLKESDQDKADSIKKTKLKVMSNKNDVNRNDGELAKKTKIDKPASEALPKKKGVSKKAQKYESETKIR